MLRESQPVLATEHLGRPTFMLTRYDDCLAALKDAETFSSRSNAEAGQVLGRTVLEMDGRAHGRYRALVQPAFVPMALERLGRSSCYRGNRRETRSCTVYGCLPGRWCRSS